MHPLPHYYHVSAIAEPDAPVSLDSGGLPPLSSAPPRDFGGSGDRWSPETLLVAAVCDCFVLTFRAIAKAVKFGWKRLECEGEGTLDRVDGIMCFTGIELQVRLEVSNPADRETALKLLEKTEKGCLISNSLRFAPTLHAHVSVKQAA